MDKCIIEVHRNQQTVLKGLLTFALCKVTHPVMDAIVFIGRQWISQITEHATIYTHNITFRHCWALDSLTMN